MAFITTSDGVALHYNDWGSGKAVVLIHGWPLDADMWEYQSVRLAEAGYRVITYDRRGFGRSAQPWTGYDYDILALDLGRILESLAISDATLVGFSMGGGEVARYMTIAAGGRVAKTVFVASVAPYLLKTADNPNGVDQTLFTHVIAGLRADRPDFLSGFAEQFYGVGLLTSPVSQPMLDWTAQMALLASPRATIECVKTFSTTDLRKDVAAITTPTLILHGSADKIVPPALS